MLTRQVNTIAEQVSANERTQFSLKAAHLEVSLYRITGNFRHRNISYIKF